jgi:hypothetical protein
MLRPLLGRERNRTLHGPLFCMSANFNRALTNAGSWLSRPEPVVAVGVYIGLWLIFEMPGTTIEASLAPTLT